jgi:hypothetical protein
VQQVAVVAHEPSVVDNRIVNHWATYLMTGEDESIRLDMTPGGVSDKDGCQLGGLMVQSLSDKYSINNCKVLELQISRPVQANEFLDVVLARNYDRYTFTASGVGCRFWTTEAVTAFEEEDLLVRGSADAVREVIEHGWEEGGILSTMEPVPLERGTFY